MYIVVKRHEKLGNREAYGPFEDFFKAAEFSEKMGDYYHNEEDVHFDVMPLTSRNG